MGIVGPTLFFISGSYFVDFLKINIDFLHLKYIKVYKIQGIKFGILNNFKILEKRSDN